MAAEFFSGSLYRFDSTFYRELLSNYQDVSWRNTRTADLINLCVSKPAAYKDKRGGNVVKIKCTKISHVLRSPEYAEEPLEVNERK